MNTTGTTSQSLIKPDAARTLAGFLPVAVFSLLTGVGAQIAIPAVPVPFTLQTVFVLLSGALLGARRGAASQILYLGAGALGAPVFAGFKGSFLHLLGPTGGYLLAFPVAAFLAGYLLNDLKVLHRLPVFLVSVLCMAIAMLVIFLAGITQLNLVVFHNWQASLAAGFVHLQIWDAVKILAAATIYSQMGRRNSRSN